MIALWPVRFFARLMHVVTMGAGGLPIPTVPEQHHVPPVGLDVIDQLCNQRTTLTLDRTPRVDGQKPLRLFAPSVVVTALVCSTPHLTRHRSTRNIRSHQEQGLRRNRSRAANFSTVPTWRSPRRLAVNKPSSTSARQSSCAFSVFANSAQYSRPFGNNTGLPSFFTFAISASKSLARESSLLECAQP